MGTDKKNPELDHVISGEDVEKYIDLLRVFVYNFPGSTPSAFALSQMRELEEKRK